MLRNWYQHWRHSDFWLANQPNSHFDTPSTLCPGAVADLVSGLTAGRPGWILELGAGQGRLLAALAALHPGIPRYGVDLRPAAPSGSCWWQAGWDTGTESWTPPLDRLLAGLTGPGLLLAIEWLDDLPCPVLEPGDRDDALAAADRQWLARWWPRGAAREVGRTRDRAWAWWADRLPAGSTLVTLDYGHTATERPARGSFTGFRDGQRIDPAPAEAGRTNLTAAVAVDALAAELEARGAQRVALTRLADLPPQAEPAPGLAGLALRSQYAVLRDRSRFGDFWLVAHQLPGGAAARMAR